MSVIVPAPVIKSALIPWVLSCALVAMDMNFRVT